MPWSEKQLKRMRVVGLWLGMAAAGSCAARSVQLASRSVPVQGPAEAPPEYPKVEFEALGYDPGQARHLDLIQKSELSLDAAESSVLAKNGFVISGRRRFDSFGNGYASIYKNDLPVYVSADSILDALHRSYGDILKQLEREVVIEEYARWLDDVRVHLAVGAASAFGAVAERDVNEYLAVPEALLRGRAPTLVRGGDAGRALRLVTTANRATGRGTDALFGRPHEIDFSQFKPRGHYAGDPQLERFFRSMMWFGRIDLRVIDGTTQRDRELSRRSLDAMLALRTLVDPTMLRQWNGIDRALASLVGERDSMSFPELDRMLVDLGIPDPVRAKSLPDAAWLGAFQSGQYGTQRIASHLRHNVNPTEAAPLPASFTPFGQRFVADSEVLSKLVYDRLIVKGKPWRLMPSPLDIAYTTLDNGHAKALLQTELSTYGYENALDAARAEANQLGDEFWTRNLYSLWLESLRTLSPATAKSDSRSDGLPAVARTEAWGRRILQTQLASWAELRHDTVLYAKQSYTSDIMCEFPDAYVDPYPEFYGTLEKLAARGKDLGAIATNAGAKGTGKRIDAYFTHLATVSSTLRNMAERQRRGEPFSAAQIKFVNQTVALKKNFSCGGGNDSFLTGWYARLFYDPETSLTYEPTIADVHTQPTDAGGTPVGRVLHVGTGRPELMVVTIDTCNGASSYVGLTFSYYERTTSHFKRTTDAEWKAAVDRATSPDWLRPVIANGWPAE